VQVEPGTHRAGVRIFAVAPAVPDVSVAEAIRDEQLDRLAQKLVARVSEQALGLGVHEHDLAAGVCDDHRVRRRLEQPPEAILGATAVGDVAHGADHELPPLGRQRAQRDLDRELRAVRAEPAQVEVGSHRACVGVRPVAVAMPRVAPAQALGHERLDRLADEVGAGVSEEQLGLRVDEDYAAALVDDDHAVRGGFQQALEAVRQAGDGRRVAGEGRGAVGAFHAAHIDKFRGAIN